MKPKIKIMLIEDSPEYREVIEMAITKEADMELCGAFGAAEGALRSLQNPKPSDAPDLILLDLNLPGMSGHEAMPWINKYTPDVKIIVLSQSNREADVLRAISQGASGYLLKASTVQQIKEGIRSVMNGSALLGADVAQYMIRAVKTQSDKVPLEKPLSGRELEILILLGEGQSQKEIADQLKISAGTVATHTRRIYRKLQAENAPAAISNAYQAGILPGNG
jgi:DNA-binding NarL/FixJ family response regulator